MKKLYVIKAIQKMLKSNDLLEKSREREEDFTRKSKLDFLSLVMIILTLVRKSMQIELDCFFEKNVKKGKPFSKQVFSKARKKLLPEAFILLNDLFVERYYDDGNFKTIKGYRIFGVDGSMLELPNTAKIKDEFGVQTNQSTKIEIPTARISTLFDVLNRTIFDAKIDSFHGNEREMAKLHLEKLEIINKKSNVRVKDLLIFDRGYPSINLIYSLLIQKKYFLMRVSKSFVKEFNSFVQSSSREEILEVTLTKSRIKECDLKSINSAITENEMIRIRALKITLDSGETEYLLTNLIEDFIYDDFKELYFLRWSIETNYDFLKNKIEIENFSGKTAVSVKQDFHAAIFVCNLALLIATEAQNELGISKKN